jgi:hypothetical protein
MLLLMGQLDRPDQCCMDLVDELFGVVGLVFRVVGHDLAAQHLQVGNLRKEPVADPIHHSLSGRNGRTSPRCPNDAFYGRHERTVLPSQAPAGQARRTAVVRLRGHRSHRRSQSLRTAAASPWRSLVSPRAPGRRQDSQYLELDLSARIVVLIGAVALAGAGWWWWHARCETACAEVDRGSQEMLERGDLVAALTLIDGVDARCRCGRFTSGDAPPQYSLAQACLGRLRTAGRSAEVDALLNKARGPILIELGKRR